LDGLPGLEKVFKEEFPNSKIQHCQVHVARNVLTKVPRKMKRVVADRLRDIFYASKKERTIEHYRAFLTDYERLLLQQLNPLKTASKHVLLSSPIFQKNGVKLEICTFWKRKSSGNRKIYTKYLTLPKVVFKWVNLQKL
jgi:hypothetical protein